jgi:hypothetical protein
VKNRPSLFLAVLIQVAACGASAVAPLDSAGDQTSETADLETAADQPFEATRMCLEFLACPRANLIYGPDGCPIGCNVNGPPGDALGIDFAGDRHFSTAADASDGGCDTDAAGCSAG